MLFVGGFILLGVSLSALKTASACTLLLCTHFSIILFVNVFLLVFVGNHLMLRTLAIKSDDFHDAICQYFPQFAVCLFISVCAVFLCRI